MNDSVRICLFAKAPIAGQVKTRMQPVLSTEQSLALHRDLLATCCDNLARAAAPGQVELHVTEAHPEFVQLSERYGFPICRQRGRHLGARMSHAVQVALKRASTVVLVGADCPSVDVQLIAELQDALGRCDAVMVPALDGGYVALGLKRHAPELFCDVPWGSAEVAAETRRRFMALHWRWTELAPQPDIDRPEDLVWLDGGLAHWRMR